MSEIRVGVKSRAGPSFMGTVSYDSSEPGGPPEVVDHFGERVAPEGCVIVCPKDTPKGVADALRRAGYKVQR